MGIQIRETPICTSHPSAHPKVKVKGTDKQTDTNVNLHTTEPEIVHHVIVPDITTKTLILRGLKKDLTKDQVMSIIHPDQMIEVRMEDISSQIAKTTETRRLSLQKLLFEYVVIGQSTSVPQNIQWEKSITTIARLKNQHGLSLRNGLMNQRTGQEQVHQMINLIHPANLRMCIIPHTMITGLQTRTHLKTLTLMPVVENLTNSFLLKNFKKVRSTIGLVSLLLLIEVTILSWIIEEIVMNIIGEDETVKETGHMDIGLQKNMSIMRIWTYHPVVHLPVLDSLVVLVPHS